MGYPYQIQPQSLEFVITMSADVTAHNGARSAGRAYRAWLHYDDLTWTSCSLKSPVIRLFVQYLMRAHINETSTSDLLALWEVKSTVSGEFPAQRASNAKKLPFDDVIMLNLCTNVSLAMDNWKNWNGINLQIYIYICIFTSQDLVSHIYHT